MQLELNELNSQALGNLCGIQNINLQSIEKLCTIKMQNRGAKFLLEGQDANIQLGKALLLKLAELADKGDIDEQTPLLVFQDIKSNQPSAKIIEEDKPNFNMCLHLPKAKIRPHGKAQADYLQSIFKKDISFGIGPAGTGKTFLAVAAAADYLLQARVEKLILVRPAVEAGEKLGFLPGDLNQKVDPYLRPLYDALFFVMGIDKVNQLLERQIIEIAPLAYMRGRTLNNAFVILDESQNTTKEQMKMFLTRLGYGSKAVITGDLTQVDLPRGMESGLTHASKILANIKEIGIDYFHSEDVVRHPLIQKIIKAYDAETLTQGAKDAKSKS